jgi:beta-lactamase regulating signal transducer with metallopeptidase domain
MNVSSQLLWWCPLQVTVLAALALGIDALIARRRPAAGALVAATALVAVVGLTAGALSPWPSWHSTWDRLPWRQVTVASDSAPDDATTDPSLRSRLPEVTDEDAGDGLPRTRPLNVPPPKESFLARSWKVVAGNGATLAALLYLAGVGAMAVRFCLGLAAVRGYRRGSRLLRDRRLAGLLDLVREQLGESQEIEIRESDQLSTPATIGWRRPILLLPRDWPEWTDDECRAVLAHEVEHIRRRDFSSWIVAQFGVALHFYHPLVHWLAARLRLKQELAADAAAARVVGGQRKYVETLAAMALRQSDALVAWPARAFLPTSKTFLRRIEMLHQSKSLRSDVSRPLLFLTVTAVAVAALVAAGIRGSAAGDGQAAGLVASLDTPDANQPKTPVAISPERSRQAMNNLKMLALAMHNYHDKHKHFPPAVVMGPDGKTPHSWRVELLPFLDAEKLFREYRENEPWDSPINAKVLRHMPDVFRSPFDAANSTDSSYYVFTGPGTIFDGPNGTPISSITDGTSNTLLVVESERNIPWTKPEDIPFDPNKPLPTLGGYVEGRFLAALADGSARRFETDKIKDLLKALIMRNDGTVIDWSQVGLVPAPHPVGRATPLAATDKPGRTRENLKTLGLVMHNYHDVHRHFPPAVVMGPDGKTPHSWRVEVLPYLDQKPLYDQYRLNEPWDSPANQKVLAQMPDWFRSPYDDPKSPNSGFYALVGAGTIFEGTEGIKIRDITDGTSNTIMIVESKRNIPWTKPEDIPFDADKPLPELGGFVEGKFAAVMADGAFRLFDTEQIKDKLKWLIRRNDGQVIQ